ncbi:MAG: YhfC family intramembrane metalloprotease [Lachnospiraceae bacterium]|nr:YhfC family intramembrane metalloprotease [Lachnospiraceae bacterium]
MDLSQCRVPDATMFLLFVRAIVCLGLPIVLMLIWRKKTGAKLRSCLLGMATFVIFALILETILHNVVLLVLGEEKFTSTAFYAIYGGLAAGVFEEYGRYIVMRNFMKTDLEKKESVMFGIGHGGIESIILIGTSTISSLAMAFTLNAGMGNMLIEGMSPDLQQQLYEQISPLWLSAPPAVLAGIVERAFAITYHICASYIVYRSVKDKKISLCLLAVLLHALMDGLAVTLSRLTGSALITEAFIGIYTVILAVFTVKAYKNEKEDTVIPE